MRFIIPDDFRIHALMIGGRWMYGPQAHPYPALGSGVVHNRYAKEGIEITSEEIQKVDDFVTQKLLEARSTILMDSRKHCGYCNKKVIAPCTSRTQASHCLNRR